MKHWQCFKCGHEVFSNHDPTPINWTDGHKCVFMEVRSMEDRIGRMALRTWDIIGHDVLQVVPMMSKAEVVEVVCDADHMKMYGDDPQAYDHWRSLTFDEQTETVAKAFPFEYYTM